MDVVKELEFDKEVLKRIEMICRFACVKPIIKQGSIINIRGTNIAYENFNFTTNDLLVLEGTKKIDELIYPDKLMENILSLTNAPREEMKQIIATYIDNVEVNKVGDHTE